MDAGGDDGSQCAAHTLLRNIGHRSCVSVCVHCYWHGKMNGSHYEWCGDGQKADGQRAYILAHQHWTTLLCDRRKVLDAAILLKNTNVP